MIFLRYFFCLIFGGMQVCDVFLLIASVCLLSGYKDINNLFIAITFGIDILSLLHLGAFEINEDSQT
jgi:hypothetical protein